jgi:hypothetical protein
MYVLRGASAYVCLFSQLRHAAFGSDLRLRAVDDGHWRVHNYGYSAAVHLHSQRANERERASETEKPKREDKRERESCWMKIVGTSKPFGLSSTTQKVFIFPFGLKWSKIN